MIVVRRSTVLADAKTSRTSTSGGGLARVGADPRDWYYKDSNGKLWAFTDRGDGEGVDLKQRFVASTGAYAESTYRFYDSTSEGLRATVDDLARLKAEDEDAGTSNYSTASDPGADDLAIFSSAIESEEGPIASATEIASYMSEGISEHAAIDRAVKKKAGTTSKSPPTPAGGVLLKTVQASLIKLGYDLGSYGADGKIGPYTRGAIVKFKKDHGISPANSTIDPPFLEALDAAANPSAPTSPAPAAAIGGLGLKGILAAVGATVVAIGLYFVLRK